MAASGPKGTFEDFLAELLNVESGIDARRFDWYVQNDDAPVMSCPRVAAPGRALRDPETGGLVVEPITVGEYFARLGVDTLFDRKRPTSLRAMQYRATNALGFVGYQIGEAILITNGYYEPERVVRVVDGREREYESYYVGSVPNSTWRNGAREAIVPLPGSGREVLATDVNAWRGTFAGKDGICSLEDLKTPEKQDRVMRTLLRANHEIIGRHLFRRRLKRLLGRDRPADPPRDQQGARGVTTSGLLAAAHLCGPYAVIAFLEKGDAAADELGTSLTHYLMRFAGYDTPFGEPSGWSLARQWLRRHL